MSSQQPHPCVTPRTAWLAHMSSERGMGGKDFPSKGSLRVHHALSNRWSSQRADPGTGNTPSDPHPRAADSFYRGGSEPHTHRLCTVWLQGRLVPGRRPKEQVPLLVSSSWWAPGPSSPAHSVRGSLVSSWPSGAAEGWDRRGQRLPGMGRATGNPAVPACAFPRGTFSPGAWPFPGLRVTADMASDVYRKGASTHNTRKGAWESRTAESILGGVPPPTAWPGDPPAHPTGKGHGEQRLSSENPPRAGWGLSGGQRDPWQACGAGGHQATDRRGVLRQTVRDGAQAG